MKAVICGLLIFTFSPLFFGFARSGHAVERPERLQDLMNLLPPDGEIRGWQSSEKTLRASNEEELYRIFDGGAGLYIQHGFRSFVARTYRDAKGTELEVHIFDQGTPQNTEDLFQNPYTKPSRIQEMADLGEKARMDMTPLFCYGVDFIQKGFFVRVIIQERTEGGLNTAISFARSISKRIK
jgi:hypothetical protein